MTKYRLTLQNVRIPTGSGGATVTVEEDSDTDGTVENTDTITLVNAQTAYLTNDVFAGTGEVRLDWNLGPSTDVATTTAIVESVELSIAGTEWAWDESQSESGVVHQSTANTDHNDASNLKQGYDYANFSEITPDPVSCWPFHEDSGGTAYDLAGTNDGSISGATVNVTGLLGTTAYSFDGTDDQVGPFDSTTDFDFTTGTFTLSAWFKKASNKTRNPIIAKDTFRGFKEDRDYHFGCSGGSYYAGIADGTGDAEGFPDVGTAPNDTWTHLVFVVGSSDFFLYENGTQIATASRTIDPQNTNDLYIGHDSPNSATFDGDIADVRIYNTPLTATEVGTLYDVVATQGTWTGTAKPL